eukprot:gnl/TRDRNA2_/TRDRNA2_160286_c1_seq4.p1 gnl/TRDRNA2_/TRDRNA2_160286_c1~~gnl/TRDRNA2_/TRDRNA2_160286_c1_seq4.p1  ORF type:complete len:292 (+),score=89.92 gnl/TRDRNA2_/TRDRNA2_160286_c1_seq4:64-939(+)
MSAPLVFAIGAALLSCGRTEDDDDTLASFGKRLTTEEMFAVHALLDADKDGKASLEEMLAYQKQMRVRQSGRGTKAFLEHLDKNEDGYVDLAEAIAELATDEQEGELDDEDAQLHAWNLRRKAFEELKFDAADKNKDSLLSMEELAAFMNPEIDDSVLEVATRYFLVEKDVDRDSLLNPMEFWIGEEINQRGAAAALEGVEQVPEEKVQEFNELDKNKDGRIDQKELKVLESGLFHTEQILSTLLTAVDSDHDGYVTAQELQDNKDSIYNTDAHQQLREFHDDEYGEPQEL